MAEQMFIWNLQRSYQNEENHALLWGNEIMNGGFRSLSKEFLFPNPDHHAYLCYDIKGFDKKAQHTIIDDVHNMWLDYFDFNQYEETNEYHGEQSKCDATRIRRLWDWMTHSIKSTPILLPNGEVWKWIHTGIASGFQQTQLLDSPVNSIKIITCLFAMGIDCNSASFKARFQGDDSLIRFISYILILYGTNFIPMLSECMLYYFDTTTNLKKTIATRDWNKVNVLGYYHRNGYPYKPIEELLQHLFYPDREHDSFEQLQARAIGLCYASCGSSEPFYQVCKQILIDTTKEIGTTDPDFKGLRFLKFIIDSTILDEDLKELKTIPSFHELCGRVQTHSERTESQKQRIWPTYATYQRSFYFLYN